MMTFLLSLEAASFFALLFVVVFCVLWVLSFFQDWFYYGFMDALSWNLPRVYRRVDAWLRRRNQ